MTKSLYQDFFGIRENPFSIIPDPHYLYMGPRHQEALAHLLFGVGEGGGFVLLTGEVGTGKTTVCRALAEQLPENADLALILNPKLGELELMSAICDEMHINYPEDTDNLKSFFDILNHHLLDAHSRGRSPVLLIDEAQALPEESIELVRLLTNLETSEKKLLQIILVGQPELNHILAKPQFRQTAQRITARYHLDALGLADCKKYIDHRLRVAGINETVFSAGAIRTIKKASGGIPRLINSICDRALLGAYALGIKKINKKIASRAAGEVLGRGTTPSASGIWLTGLFVLGVAVFAIIVAMDPGGHRLKEKSSAFVDLLLSESKKIDPSVASVEKVEKDLSVVDGKINTQTQVIGEENPQNENVDAINGQPMPDENKNKEIVFSEETVETDALSEILKTGTPETAFIRLFNLWEKDYLRVSGLTQCDKAKNAGLSCAQGISNIDGLKAMNRPALVSFTMPSGESVYGVVTQIKVVDGDNLLTIEFAERQVTMTTKALSIRWMGDYLVLWKQPDFFTRPISVGVNGNDVVAIRKLLALAGFADSPQDSEGRGSPFFGTTLQAQAMAFQRSFGLLPDGIIGPETLLRITGVVGDINGPSIVWEDN